MASVHVDLMVGVLALVGDVALGPLNESVGAEPSGTGDDERAGELTAEAGELG